MTRDFPIGDILSITTGILLTPDMGRIYAILNFMTKDDLFTHQLPRAMRECQPWLLRQHPQLAGVDASGVGELNWREWLDAQTATFGESLPVEPIPADDHEAIDPVEELERMAGKDRAIAVRPEGGPQ